MPRDSIPSCSGGACLFTAADGRPLPENPRACWYGTSVGRWQGDTLVIDTVGFADSFWMNRLGLPDTDQLHTIERISRPNFDTLIHEVTIDDPGAIRPRNIRANLTDYCAAPKPDGSG